MLINEAKKQSIQQSKTITDFVNLLSIKDKPLESVSNLITKNNQKSALMNNRVTASQNQCFDNFDEKKTSLENLIRSHNIKNMHTKGLIH